MIYTNDDSRIKSVSSFMEMNIRDGMSLRDFLNGFNRFLVNFNEDDKGLVLFYDNNDKDFFSTFLDNHCKSELDIDLIGEHIYNNVDNKFYSAEKLVIVSKELYLETKEFLNYKNDFNEYMEYKEEFIKYKNSCRKKVNPRIVQDIKERYKKEKTSYRKLAKHYKISIGTISKIINNKY